MMMCRKYAVAGRSDVSPPRQRKNVYGASIASRKSKHPFALVHSPQSSSKPPPPASPASRRCLRRRRLLLLPLSSTGNIQLGHIRVGRIQSHVCGHDPKQLHELNGGDVGGGWVGRVAHAAGGGEDGAFAEDYEVEFLVLPYWAGKEEEKSEGKG